jgi:hypothetical protein
MQGRLFQIAVFLSFNRLLANAWLHLVISVSGIESGLIIDKNGTATESIDRPKTPALRRDCFALRKSTSGR